MPGSRQIPSAGTKSHQNVPACATMGTLRHQNVPGRQQFSSVGTKSHQNVPAYRRVGTLRHQNVPERQHFFLSGTKSLQNVPGRQQFSSAGTLQRQKLLFTWEHSLNNTLLHLQYPLQLFVGSIIAKFQETCDFNFLLFAQQLGFR